MGRNVCGVIVEGYRSGCCTVCYVARCKTIPFASRNHTFCKLGEKRLGGKRWLSPSVLLWHGLSPKHKTVSGGILPRGCPLLLGASLKAWSCTLVAVLERGGRACVCPWLEKGVARANLLARKRAWVKKCKLRAEFPICICWFCEKCVNCGHNRRFSAVSEALQRLTS